MVDTFLFKDLNTVGFTEMYETSGGSELYVQSGRMGKGEKEKNTFPFAFEKDALIKYQVISYFD